MSRLTIFAGAPEPSSLQWDEGELSNDILPCFLNPNTVTIGSLPSADSGTVKWRSISLQPERLRTGISQLFEHDVSGIASATSPGNETSATPFFTIADLPQAAVAGSALDGETGLSSSTETESELLSQFYDHSFAIHEDISSSQIPVSTQFPGDNNQDTAGHSPRAASIISQPPRGHGVTSPHPPTPLSGHLSDLEDIPGAAFLRSITPQTMTVNLIVGIIALPQPRTVKTRRWGREMGIAEMLAGDETKAGFGITFWLPPAQEDRGSRQDNMRSTLGKLRPQDIILLRTVALSSFRGQVHGQSLRKDMTKVELLYRRRIDSSDDGGRYTASDIGDCTHDDPLLIKIKRVRDWILNFVGGAGVSGENTSRDTGTTLTLHALGKSRVLPPDTQ